LLSTSAYSALEVLHIMRYINLLTYLPTYFSTKNSESLSVLMSVEVRLTQAALLHKKAWLCFRN